MPRTTLSLIEVIQKQRLQVQADPDRDARFRALQTWQVQRLSRTYADLLQQPRYRSGLEFFMQDVYGPHDFSQRDRELRKVIGPWEGMMPARALATIQSALELEALTQSLDLSVLEVLGAKAPTEQNYADAYRRANRRADRERQIALIVNAGDALEHLVRMSWVRTALRLARTPARLAGVQALQDFLERGCAAFATLRSPRDLLSAIEKRETQIMEQLFAGSPAPFDVADSRQRRPRAERS
ncbi:MAG: hypothetical protein ABW034_01575 [Steroidobacteraceae bacterium]